jgi:PAS domain S-box-containing protein
LNRLGHDPRYGPWLDEARKRGFASSAAFPIMGEGRVLGALSVYSDHPDSFDSAESRLLEDVASALTLGISRARKAQERERASQALRLAHDELAAVQNAVPDMVFVHAGDGRLLHVNAATERFYGLSEEEMCAIDPQRLMGGGHSFEEAAAHVRYALEHGSDDFTWQGRKADGTVFPCEVRLRRLPGTRQSIEEPHVVAVTRDLTELSRLQDELAQMQRLESLAVLAGGIAHDFNNLLAGILGNIDLARVSPELSGQTRELLDEAKAAAQRAQRSSKKLLAFAHGGDTRPIRMDLRDAVSEAAAFVFSGATVKYELQLPEVLTDVECAPDPLAQMLGNLLQNALEASTDGGPVQVSLRAGSDWHVLDIRDHGAGVDAAVAAHIFEPFFTTKPGASGLGLSSAFGIARRHGGQLELLPTDGPGATFRLTLLAAPPARDSVAPAPQESIVSAKRALVMDDQEGLRRLFGRMLERAGFEVVGAADGDEALRICRQAREAGKGFCLALLDLTVPGGRGGHEIVPELRDLDPGLALVAATGYADSDARAADFDGFLAKPFTLLDLEAELRRLFPED